MGDPRQLHDFSVKELQEEIDRRKNEKPKKNYTVNWSLVVKYVEQAVDQLHQGKGLPKDFEHYLMEGVLEAMYGGTIWEWWNGRS